MKNLFKLNLFFVGIPIILCLFGLINENYYYLGLISTILTGIFQVVISIKMIQDEPNDKNIKIYLAGVILFFFTLFIVSKIDFSDSLKYILLLIPPILAIYLSIIIYKKQ